MNKNMRMFIVCVVFALLSSCKNDAISKDLESSVQSEQEIKKEFNGLLNILETKDLFQLDEKDTKEIEKTIKDLKDKVEKTDSKKTPIGTYLEYEKKIQEIREKLKGKGNFEDKLNGLEESLTKKKEERKKALQEAKQKFEEFQNQVNTTTGVTTGQRAGNQGAVGAQAFKCAKEFGLSVSSSSKNGTDTGDMSKGIIDDAIKKIEEELKNTIEDTKE
ncbi:ErpL protein (plasmid) [Borreliella japonica]|uniref:ErpL protein n=1 Tax=Borreliella japonica TaxID=34095 RepID=UPI003AB7F592